MFRGWGVEVDSDAGGEFQKIAVLPGGSGKIHILQGVCCIWVC